MHDIFISYSSIELESAEAVRNVLENNQIPCWMAPRDIPVGSNYAKEIPSAIRNCKVFLLMLSQKAQQSMWVQKELDMAIGSGKIIIPFVLEDCSLTDEFNFLLTGVQRYDAYKKKVDAMESLVGRIYAITGKRPALPPQPPEQEPGEPVAEQEADDSYITPEEADTHVQSPAEDDPAQGDTVVITIHCPNCGSDHVISLKKNTVGKTAAGAVVGATVASICLPLFPLAAPIAGAVIGGRAVRRKGKSAPTEYRCTDCGKKFVATEHADQDPAADTEPASSEPDNT